MTNRARSLLLLILALAVCLFPQGGRAEEPCLVYLEAHPQIVFQRQMYAVEKGQDLVLTLYLLPDAHLLSCDFGLFGFSPEKTGDDGLTEVTVTLRQVRESAHVRFIVLTPQVTLYENPLEPEARLRVLETAARLRVNSLPWEGQFRRAGWLAVGWNTTPDGMGTHVGFGSRFFRSDDGERVLYPEWLQCTPEEYFSYEPGAGGAWITHCETYTDLVVPDTLGGVPVVGIRAGAFGDVRTGTLALPHTLRVIEPGAFTSLDAQRIYLFDTLAEISDASFGSVSVGTLYINAGRSPVYCGTLYDVFSQVIDRLACLSEERVSKLILFSGSSGSFGWDSALIQNAFYPLQTVNIGVMSGVSLLPQARILLEYIRPGDILVFSPELNAIPLPFSAPAVMDADTFRLMESNYDMLSLVDLREYSGLFDALGEYLDGRKPMPSVSYDRTPDISPDEALPAGAPAWNCFGDYAAYRGGNPDRALFGTQVIRYDADTVQDAGWDAVNRFLDEAASLGATPFFLFAPLSTRAVFADSIPDGAKALTAEAVNCLHAHVLNTAEEALTDPVWFSGADDHLSTEGAFRRSQTLIDALKPCLSR